MYALTSVSSLGKFFLEGCDFLGLSRTLFYHLSLGGAPAGAICPPEMENRVKALLRAMHDVVAMQIRVRSKPADRDHFLKQMMWAFERSGHKCTDKYLAGILLGYRKRMMQKADAFRSKGQLLAVKRGPPRPRRMRRTRTKGAEETTDTEGEKNSRRRRYRQ